MALLDRLAGRPSLRKLRWLWQAGAIPSAARVRGEGRIAALRLLPLLPLLELLGLLCMLSILLGLLRGLELGLRGLKVVLRGLRGGVLALEVGGLLRWGERSGAQRGAALGLLRVGGREVLRAGCVAPRLGKLLGKLLLGGHDQLRPLHTWQPVSAAGITLVGTACWLSLWLQSEGWHASGDSYTLDPGNPQARGGQPAVAAGDTSSLLLHVQQGMRTLAAGANALWGSWGWRSA